MHVRTAAAALAAMVAIACRDDSATYERRVAALERHARESRQAHEQLRREVHELRRVAQAAQQHAARPSAAAATVPQPPAPVEEDHTLDNAAAIDTEQLCRRKHPLTADLPKVAECMDEQVRALEALMKGRPLGIGVSAATFMALRKRCAAAFPADFALRLYCEQREIQRVAP